MTKMGFAAVLIAVLSLTAFPDDVKRFSTAYRAYTTATEAGETEAAAEAIADAFDIAEDLNALTDAQRGAIATNYATAHMALPFSKQDEDRIRWAFKRAIHYYEQAYGDDGLELIDPLMGLASRYAKNHDLQRTNLNFRRAHKIAAQHYGDDSVATARVNMEWGKAILGDMKQRGADTYFERAIAVFETKPEYEVDLALARYWRGKYARSAHDYDTALTYVQDATATFEAHDPTSTLALAGHALMVDIYENLGDSEAATRHCRAIGQHSPRTEDQNYIPIYRPNPEYSGSRGEGHVILKLDINDAGFVENIRVDEIKGSRALARSSIKAAERFRYAPRYEDGKPVKTTDVTYKFTYAIANR